MTLPDAILAARKAVRRSRAATTLWRRGDGPHGEHMKLRDEAFDACLDLYEALEREMGRSLELSLTLGLSDAVHDDAVHAVLNEGA